MSVGTEIKKFREINKISQNEMAQRIGINRNQLSRIETDKSEPSASTLKALCEIYNLNIDELLQIKKFDNTESLSNEILELCNYLSKDDLNFILRIIHSIYNEREKKIH